MTTMTTTRYERAQMSSIYRIDSEAIDRIAASMKRDGFDETQPITLWAHPVTGVVGIIDGWHRYEAAEAAGVEPVFAAFEGSESEAAEYIGKRNSDRRNMNKSQIIAAEIVRARRTGRGQTPEEIAYVARSAVSVVNKLSSKATEDLEALAKGEKTAGEIGDKKSGSSRKLTCVKLQVSQQVKVNGFAAAFDEPPSKSARRVIDAGIAAVQPQADAAVAAAK